MSQSVMAAPAIHSQQSFFTFIQMFALPYVKVDGHDLCMDWSESFLEITDLSALDMQNDTIDQLVKKTRLLQCVRTSLTEARQSHAYARKRYDQDEMLIDVTVMPAWEDGRTVYYVVLQDFSGQRKYERLLTFYDQMENISRSAVSVAHEIRNPLSIIRGIFQLAQITNDIGKYSDTVIAEIDQANVLLEEFLSLSRQQNDRCWQSPMLLMESLARMMQAECMSSGVSFEFACSRSCAVCHVNEAMFKQVMMNLVRHAIGAYDHSRDDCFLQVKMDVIGRWVQIKMIDNGEGMSEQVLKQLEKPLSTMIQTGTGTDIQLCKKIIEDHGGIFHVDSKVRTGTKVTLKLPVLV